jgi:hypothetical protein
VISTLSDMRSRVKHLFDIGVAEFPCRRASAPEGDVTERTHLVALSG